MNILFICDEYPPGMNGGIGSLTQTLSRALVAQGHNVCVAGLYTYEYGAADYEEDNGVKVWRMRYGFRLGNSALLYKVQRKLPDNVKARLYGKKDFQGFVVAVDKIITQKKIDIVEQPDWNTFAYDIGISKPIFPALNIPLVVKSHGSHSYFSKELGTKLNQHWANIDHQLYSRADALAAVSFYTADQDRTIFGLKKTPIEILYNTVTKNELQYPEQRVRDMVFFSGSLVAKKGIFALMRAWNEVIKSKPEVQLYLFGKGPISELVELLSAEAKLSVHFMGHQPKTVLMEYLNKATLAVFPSFSETFGLAAVEAMSTGCPVIFTKLSCGPEVIQDGVDGLLVDPNSIEEISATILRLLDNGELRDELGNAGKQSVEARFDASKSIEDHLRFYKQTISRFNN